MMVHAWLSWIATAPQQTVLFWIRVYQKTLSLDHGPLHALFPHGYCRFHPTCSEYGYRAVQKHGVLRGGSMTAWRVLRCNPFNDGGEDDVR